MERARPFAKLSLTSAAPTQFVVVATVQSFDTVPRVSEDRARRPRPPNSLRSNHLALVASDWVVHSRTLDVTTSGNGFDRMT